MWYCSRKQLVVGAVSSFDGGRSSHAPTSVESRHWRGTAPLCQLMTFVYLSNLSRRISKSYVPRYSVERAVPWRGMWNARDKACMI